jgi:UPF0755 protein
VRALLFLVRLGIVVALVAGAGLFWFVKEISRPANAAGKPVVFEVPSGASGRSIAQTLEEKGLITNAMAFRLLLKVKEKKQGATLRAGYFSVDPSEDLKDVLDQLLEGDVLTRKATIPEGYTLEQTAQALEKQGVCRGEDLWEAIHSDKRDLGWKFPDELEGYLFPSTYEFPWECTGAMALRQMTDEFKASVAPVWARYQATAPLSFKDCIILASLVEREAQVPSERPTIASVYVNRIRKGMKLECDATVQYALGKQKAVLLYADLEIASPYNTYRYAGLPPGPICSPGLASIEAAMHPKKTEYLFYVRNDIKDDGSHVFGRDFYEHEANIARYQK